MSREGPKARREETHRGRGWSMRAHDGAKGPWGQQSESILVVVLLFTYSEYSMLFFLMIKNIK